MSCENNSQNDVKLVLGTTQTEPWFSLFMQANQGVGNSAGARMYVKSVFDSFDKDSSGSLDENEFRDLCSELGYCFDDAEVFFVFLGLHHTDPSLAQANLLHCFK